MTDKIRTKSNTVLLYFSFNNSSTLLTLRKSHDEF
jgi:hypothetical protein